MWRRGSKDKDWNPDEVVAYQRAMNAQTWAALQAHGVTEETQLRLDFTYDSPSREAAEALADFLRAATDYDVTSNNDSVTGSTQLTNISHAILDEWVEWMVSAGYEYGRSKFDGWGAAVP
jgi:hypothetical protein